MWLAPSSRPLSFQYTDIKNRFLQFPTLFNCIKSTKLLWKCFLFVCKTSLIYLQVISVFSLKESLMAHFRHRNRWTSLLRAFSTPWISICAVTFCNWVIGSRFRDEADSKLVIRLCHGINCRRQLFRDERLSVSGIIKLASWYHDQISNTHYFFIKDKQRFSRRILKLSITGRKILTVLFIL